jgi:hypothetical protein
VLSLLGVPSSSCGSRRGLLLLHSSTLPDVSLPLCPACPPVLPQVSRSYEARAPATPSSPEDAAFLVELVLLVTDWLAGRPLGDSSLLLLGGGGATNGSGSGGDQDMAAGSDEDVQQQEAGLLDELSLAPLNSFRRLLAFQELRKSQFGVATHPGFWVKKVRCWGAQATSACCSHIMPRCSVCGCLPASCPCCRALRIQGADTRRLVLVRATAQQAEALEAQDRAARIAAIHDAAGMAAVFDLLRASNKPCVGHNCMMDIRCVGCCASVARGVAHGSWGGWRRQARVWLTATPLLCAVLCVLWPQLRALFLCRCLPACVMG